MSGNISITSEAIAERAPVRIWDLLLPLLASLIPFLLGLGGVVVMAILQSRSGSTEDMRGFLAGLGTNFMGAQIFMGVIYIAMLFGVWAVARHRGPATVSGYLAPVSGRTMVLGVFSGVAMAALVLFAIWWLGAHANVKFHATKSEETLLMAHNPLELAVSLVVVAVIAPFTEELYFRGLVLAWLRRWMWLPLAALADAAIFGLVHGRYVNHPGAEGWILTVMVALVGLLNVGWYVRTRSLWPAFLTHAFYNGMLVTLAYLSV